MSPFDCDTLKSFLKIYINEINPKLCNSVAFNPTLFTDFVKLLSSDVRSLNLRSFLK